jgi:hypothetical protein
MWFGREKQNAEGWGFRTTIQTFCMYPSDINFLYVVTSVEYIFGCEK